MFYEAEHLGSQRSLSTFDVPEYLIPELNIDVEMLRNETVDRIVEILLQYVSSYDLYRVP